MIKENEGTGETTDYKRYKENIKAFPFLEFNPYIRILQKIETGNLDREDWYGKN